MSAGLEGIAGVLEEHREDPVYPNSCICESQYPDRPEGDHYVGHVAVAVTDWLTERLTDDDVAEAVCEAIALVSGNVDMGETTAALTAVTAALRGES